MMNTPSHPYDFIVTGSGPAGLSFVKTLQGTNAGARVLLLEKDRFPREKVCGDALTYLSLPLIKQIFPDVYPRLPRKDATKRYTLIYPDGNRIRSDEQNLLVIERKTLDSLMYQSIDRNRVDIIQEASVKDIIREDGQVVGIRYDHGGTPHEARAGWAIGADGSNSIVRRKTGPTESDHRIAAVRQYFSGLPENDDGLIFFIDTKEHGYFWIFPFERDGERWANVGYGISRGDSQQVKEKYLRLLRHPVIADLLEGAAAQGPVRGFPLNLTPWRWNKIRPARSLHGPGYLLLGDAAGLIHPFTGEGISAALYSGHLAATLFSKDTPKGKLGKIYQKKLLRFLNTHYSLAQTFFLFNFPCRLPRPLQQWWTSGLPNVFRELEKTSDVRTPSSDTRYSLDL